MGIQIGGMSGGGGGAGGDALTTNPLSQFAATTSAQLRGVISDETGSGLAVFNDSPTLVTPTIASIRSPSGNPLGLRAATSNVVNFERPSDGAVIQSIDSTNLTFAAGYGGAFTVYSAVPLAASSRTAALYNGGVLISSTGNYGFASTGDLGGQDLYIVRDAANTLAQRNSTNAQTYRLYETYTDASNYSRLSISAVASGPTRIVGEAAGTGTARSLVLAYGGTTTAALTVPITSGSIVFGGGITLPDAGDIVVNATTGTKLGTATSQKLGLWNVTPIIQPAAAGQAAITDSTGGTPASSLVDVGVVFSQSAINANFATTAVLLLAMRTAMVNSGLMKGAA